MAVEGNIPSTTAQFKIGLQSAKGTPATTSFLCPTVTDSYLRPAFDVIDKGPEHGCNVTADRATARRSESRRSSYMVAGGLTMAAYPRTIPALLAALGFAIASSDETTYFEHVATIATRPNWPWVTCMHDIGSKVLRGSDMRASQLTFNADQNGLTFDATFAGLVLGNAAGTETHTAETSWELLPSAGSISIQLDPDGTPVEIANIGAAQLARSLQITIDNPLDEAQQTLFSFGRADLPPQGLGITGTVGGLDVDWATYNRIVNGGAAATAPSANTAIASLDLTFESPENIDGAAVPYSMQLEIPYMQINLDDSNFQASGNNLISWTFNWEMIDRSSAPATFTIHNDHASYAHA